MNKLTNQQINLEVCIDNIESLTTVNSIKIDRIELCSSLALGGLSPTLSLLDYSSKNTEIPINAMVRPRPGNFNYSREEINACLEEVKLMSKFNISGVVFGALDNKNQIDFETCKRISDLAKKNKLQITFHRAIDMTVNYENSIEQLIELGFSRILTSGHTDNVEKGLTKLNEIQKKYGNKIQIMAGGGVKYSNIELLLENGIKHIHCSASTMKQDNTNYVLGKNAGDLSYQITDFNTLSYIKQEINTYSQY